MFRPLVPAWAGGPGWGLSLAAGRRRGVRSRHKATFTAALAMSLVLTVAGVAVAYGVSELRENVRSSTLPPPWASDRRPLDPEWRTLRAPYEFDSMFRAEKRTPGSPPPYTYDMYR